MVSIDNRKIRAQLERFLVGIQSKGMATIGITSVAIIGAYLLVSSHAATPATSIEAENGSIGGGTTQIIDNTASGSAAVKFANSSGGGTGARSCPSYPAFPDASCTGVPSGTTLTPYNGTLTITQANAVIDSLDISGDVVVAATNVTIKKCKIHGTGTFGIMVQSGNLTITDSELYGYSEAAIAFDNWTAYRVNIHGMGSDGVKFGSNTHLEDSYIHDFTTDAGSHADGGQMQSGEHSIVVRHNWINPLSGENSALFFAPDQGPTANGPITIDSNLLGGGNYTIYIVDGNNGQYHESGYTVTNNHFLRNATYGATNINEPVGNFTQWSGNVYDDNGAIISL